MQLRPFCGASFIIASVDFASFLPNVVLLIYWTLSGKEGVFHMIVSIFVGSLSLFMVSGRKVFSLRPMASPPPQDLVLFWFFDPLFDLLILVLLFTMTPISRTQCLCTTAYCMWRLSLWISYFVLTGIEHIVTAIIRAVSWVLLHVLTIDAFNREPVFFPPIAMHVLW